MPPLAGVRVLDLSRVLAGPWCTQCMADLGAEVWKIEPLWGDETRAWGPPFDPASGQSSYFRCANRGKTSLAVDLKHPLGAALVRRLAIRADVLVENYKVGDLTRYGVGFEQLREACPHLVYVSITGYGQTGPRAAEPGYDAALQGQIGIMSVTGEREGPPQKVGVAWVDLLTAYATLSATLAALRERDATGAGRHVDMALFDVGLTAMANLAQATLDTGTEPERWGNGHAQIVPYGAFPASDGWFMLAVGNDMQFAKLCQAIGRAEWARGEWSTNEGRVQNRGALVSALETELRSQPRHSWIERFKAEGVPCGPVNTLGEALADPQTVHRELVRDGRLSSPFGSRNGDNSPSTPSPDLGQGGWDLLKRELSMADAEIEELVQAGCLVAKA